MKNRLYITLLLVALALCARAETIVLHTGARVQGTIVFQNEEVVIVRDAEGARFQYPRADIQSILTEVEMQEEEAPVEEEKIETPKKAQILLELAGGGAVNPGAQSGGAASVDLLVGTHHIGNKHIFIGAGLGYHGIFMGEKYNFLPIQVALRMPVLEQKHAPVFGVSAGYGIGLSKDYRGGIYAALDFGYRYQFNPKSAFAITFNVQFQQAKVAVTEVLDGNEFTNYSGRSLVMPGVKLALYF